MKRDRKISQAGRYLVSLALLLLVASAIAGGVWAKDQLDRRGAAAAAQAKWRIVRAQVASRMDGQHALEFGAVWMTHRGRICGLVNGGSSFGGLTGMVPFFQDGDLVRYPLTSTHKQWAPGWRECSADTWYMLHQGSTQTGFCATRAGQSRCRTYG